MHPDRQRIIAKGSHVKPAAGPPKHAKQKKTAQAAREEELALDKTISGVKKRLRDLSRELSHKDDMPMTLRREKERELDALRVDLEADLRKKAKSQRISRYHHARFFERQKATRSLKKAQKKATAEPADSPKRKELEAAVHEAEVSLNYTMYSPLLHKYVSLWSKDGMGSGFKSPTWYLVEAAMATKTLQQLRDRVTTEDRDELDRMSGMGKWNELVIRAKNGNNHTGSRKDLKNHDMAGDGEEADGDGEAMKGLGSFFER